MIATRLKGGMGNQMFQYAAGRCLAQHLNTSLALDLSFLRMKGSWTPREYELGIFAPGARMLTDEESESFLNQHTHALKRLSKRWLPFLFSGNYFSEKHFHFDPAFFDQKDQTFLEGFWQSEKYFKPVENLIRADFEFPELSDEHNITLAQEIRQSNSVSIHLRRGDFLKDAPTRDFHGLCDADYYKQALEVLKSKYGTLRYFVFSDDASWVRENLDFIPEMTSIDHNKGKESYRDMQLMSYCKHHIIANSSFSWWGAWLNPDPKKTVIAPEKWFRKEGIILTDIYPSSWIKL